MEARPDMSVDPLARPWMANQRAAAKTGVFAFIDMLLPSNWAENAGNRFGIRVAIDGDTVVVAVRYADAAYVFRTTDGGATYVEVAKLTDPTPPAALAFSFGSSVAIDGATIVIGAYWGEDGAGTNSGAAYVFRTTDGGATYGLVARLDGPDAAYSDYFGSSVAIDGDTIVIGAYRDDDASGCTGLTRDTGPYCNSGSVYVFRRATYDQVAKLTASDAAPADHFGGSVAIDGDTVAISGGGSVYIFRTTDGGGTWSQVVKLVTSDGVSIGRPAIAGDVVVAGAFGDDSIAETLAQLYVFRTSDGGATYVELAKLTASDAALADYFGISVAIAGDTIVVGASRDDDGGWSSGSVYVFQTDDDGATYGQVAKPTAADAMGDEYFGASVAMDGSA